MVDLSIIIVSYNVKYFLVKCLESIYASKASLEFEVIVVDNASPDDTTKTVSHIFPDVKLIKNNENLGFSKANNLGIHQAKGKYILILNPDTILAEDTLVRCFEFLEENLAYGAVGVKMVDGSGRYLPESKRGLPTVSSSIFKLSGLNLLFPQHSKINHYYLGHLDENESHDIQVLTGAFIFIRSGLLRDLNGFDESYFMYGEDIDLSKRILDQGIKIGYLPNTQIVHFKGESTNKIDLNFVSRFYGAMYIYYKKHHRGFLKYPMLWILGVSTFLLALVSWIFTIFRTYSKPLLDFYICFISFLLAKKLWSKYYFYNVDYFDSGIYYNVLSYSAILVIALWYFGWYEKYPKLKYLFSGILLGLIMLLIVYSVLPENMRYSRFLVFLGTIFSAAFVYLRYLADSKIFKRSKNHSFILVTEKVDEKKIAKILKEKNQGLNYLGRVSARSESDDTNLGNIDDLSKITNAYNPDIIVFNSEDVSNSVIIEKMTIPNSRVKYLITSAKNMVILGSESKNYKGQIFEIEPSYRLARPIYRRMKRSLDVIFSLSVLIIFPIFIFIRLKFINNAIDVLLARQTWVSYTTTNENLPQIMRGIFNTKALIGEVIGEEVIYTEDKSDICYAKHYHPYFDIMIILRNLKS